jgi:hypothetical protein
MTDDQEAPDAWMLGETAPETEEERTARIMSKIQAPNRRADKDSSEEWPKDGSDPGTPIQTPEEIKRTTARFIRSLPLLGSYDPNERPKDFKKLAERWIWITGIERFVKRAEPAVAWRRTQFDSEFNYLTAKQSMAGELFKLKNTLRRFEGPVFIPGAPEIVGVNYNLWRPSPIVPKEGDTSLWNEHLAFLFPNEAARDIVLDWLAWVLQNPSEMPKEALLLTGNVFGTGKSLIARVYEQIIGEHNTQRPKNSSLKGQFNSWMDKAKLVLVEELLQTGQKDIAHELKEVITEPTAEVNTTFIPAYKIASYVAMLALSNEANAFPIAVRDRRWRVVECPVTYEQQQAAVAAGYFRRIMPLCDNRKHPPTIDKDFIAAVAWDLLRRKTDGVRHWTYGNAPTTVAKSTMIELSKSDLERWLDEHRHEPPLSWGLVNVTDDLIDAIPERITRKVPNVQGVVEKWLKDQMSGAAIGDHRVRVNPAKLNDMATHTRKLWAIGELGRCARVAIDHSAEPRNALHPVKVGATYDAVRAEAVKPTPYAPVPAAEDFAEDED